LALLLNLVYHQTVPTVICSFVLLRLYLTESFNYFTICTNAQLRNNN